MEPSRKHPGVVVHSREPFNAETPLGLLRRDFVTPADLFYVRGHGDIPRVDPDHYRLEVSGLVERPLRLSLGELRDGFPQSTVTAAIQCAGSRRDGLMEAAPIPGEIPWGAGAVGSARWTGTPLREVLSAAGIGEGTRHAAFAGSDEIGGEDGAFNYGGSISIEKATGPEVLLAYEMNGEPLRPEHGFPLRVVVPGYVGARSVKWLAGIELRQTPSDNHYQARDYKLFPPNVSEETADPSGGMMLGEIPVNAAICEPSDGASLSAGPVQVRGYAVAGGGRLVERVDLSTDAGRNWVQAELLEGRDDRWAWRFWEAKLELSPGPHRMVARAFDSAAATQPESAGAIWNFKGYANNAWHAVEVEAR